MKNQDNQHGLLWKVHTTRLLKQLTEDCNSQKDIAALKRPVQVLQSLLIGVSDRCAEIDDPVLNSFMCRLQLYSVSDPDDKDYDPEVVRKIMERGNQ